MLDFFAQSTSLNLRPFTYNESIENGFLQACQSIITNFMSLIQEKEMTEDDGPSRTKRRKSSTAISTLKTKTLVQSRIEQVNRELFELIKSSKELLKETD